MSKLNAGAGEWAPTTTFNVNAAAWTPTFAVDTPPAPTSDAPTSDAPTSDAPAPAPAVAPVASPAPPVAPTDAPAPVAVAVKEEPAAATPPPPPPAAEVAAAAASSSKENAEEEDDWETVDHGRKALSLSTAVTADDEEGESAAAVPPAKEAEKLSAAAAAAKKAAEDTLLSTATVGAFEADEGAWGDEEDDDDAPPARPATPVQRSLRPNSHSAGDVAEAPPAPRRTATPPLGSSSAAAAPQQQADHQRPQAFAQTPSTRPPLNLRKAAPKVYQKPAWAQAGEEDLATVTMKRAKAILNKLTVERFDRLAGEFIAIDFATEALVDGAIDMIVEKAQKETHFVDIYAELCVRLAATPMAGLGEVEKGKKFRQMLLQRCQAEFERDHEQTMAELATMEEADRASKMTAIRKQYIGHMFFIGALYKEELLKERVMHQCITELFGEGAENPDDDKIECLTRLLTKVGKKLDADAMDNPKYQKVVKKYFKELKKLTKTPLLSSRIRFLVRDLCELRECEWKPRREIETAKTLEEIHEDVQREADIKAGLKPKKKKQQSSSSSNNNDSSSARNVVQDDGWETVGSSQAMRRLAEEQSAAPPSRSKKDSPSASTAMSSGAFGGFASLSTSSSSKDKKKKSSSKDKSSSGKGTSSSSSEEKKLKKKSSSSSSKLSTSTSSNTLEEECARTASSSSLVSDGGGATNMDHDQVVFFKDKSKAAIAEYMSIEQIGEVVATLDEDLGSAPFEARAIFVSAALDVLLNSKEKDRVRVAPMLVELITLHALDPNHVAAGFLDVLDLLADIVIDMPKAADWLGDTLKSLVAETPCTDAFLDTPPPSVVAGDEDTLKTYDNLKAYVRGAAAAA